MSVSEAVTSVQYQHLWLCPMSSVGFQSRVTVLFSGAAGSHAPHINAVHGDVSETASSVQCPVSKAESLFLFSGAAGSHAPHINAVHGNALRQLPVSSVQCHKQSYCFAYRGR